MDPVERKPFFHVMPGTRALSVSTAGCPLECSFCEVWDMALVAPEDVYAYDLFPEKIVAQAKAAAAWQNQHPPGDTQGSDKMSSCYSIIKFFSVIPAKAGIHVVSAAAWIALKSFTSCPGLRSAAPGMTVTWNL